MQPSSYTGQGRAAHLFMSLCTQKSKQISSMEEAVQDGTQGAPRTPPPPQGKQALQPPRGEAGQETWVSQPSVSLLPRLRI